MYTAQTRLWDFDRTYRAYAIRAQEAAHSLHLLSQFPMVVFGDPDQERDIARKLYVTALSLEVGTGLFGRSQTAPGQSDIDGILHRITDCEAVIQKIEAAENMHAELLRSGAYALGVKSDSRLWEKGDLFAVETQERLQEHIDAFSAITVNAEAEYQESQKANNTSAPQDINASPLATPSTVLTTLPAYQHAPQPQHPPADWPPRSGFAQRPLQLPVLSKPPFTAPQDTQLPVNTALPAECPGLFDPPRPVDQSSPQLDPSSTSYYPKTKSQHYSSRIESVMAGEMESGEQSTGSPEFTPASTRENTPASTTEAANDVIQSMKAWEVGDKEKTKEDMTSKTGTEEALTQADPAAISPDASKNTVQESKGNKPATVTTNPPNPFSSLAPDQSHLEAHILRPHVDTLSHSITWSFLIHQLPLDEDAVRAHVAKLGSDYSIVDAVADLHPSQLLRIQEHTKFRNGALVSCQHGVAVDMVTHMGTLQVKPVIFVIKVKMVDASKMPERRPLFGYNALGNNSALPSWAQPGIAQPMGVLFGGVSDNTPKDGAEPPARPPKDWFYEQKDPYGSGVDHYMTISFSDQYRLNDQSPEEIRLADYNNGLKNATTGAVVKIPLSPGNVPGDRVTGLVSDDATSRVPMSVRKPATGPFSEGYKPTPSKFGVFAKPSVSAEETFKNYLFNVASSAFQNNQNQTPLKVAPAVAGTSFFANLGTANYAASGASLFGKTPAPNSNIFGTASGAAPSVGGSSLFGHLNADKPANHNPGLFGNFGDNVAPGSGLFGQNSSTSPMLFGRQNLTSDAGPPSNRLFGAKSAGLFGSATPVPFDTAPAASSGGLFGAMANTASPAGADQSSVTTPQGLFGVPVSLTSLFGTPSPPVTALASAGLGTSGEAVTPVSSNLFATAPQSKPATGGNQFGQSRPTVSSNFGTQSDDVPHGWVAASPVITAPNPTDLGPSPTLAEENAKTAEGNAAVESTRLNIAARLQPST